MISHPCIRGCTLARRHMPDCEDPDACRGCLPRSARHGLLCESCHAHLVDAITHAPGQVDLLRATLAPVVSGSLTAETTAKIGDGLRVDSSAPHQGPYARVKLAGALHTEPIRLDCLDAARDIEDMLSQMVDKLVEDYRMAGPARLETMASRVDPRVQKWHALTQSFEWVEPDPRFEIHDACRWLLAQIERLEWQETIGDDAEVLGMAMAQGHALAPWRPIAVRQRGIPCPECQRMSLVQMGGMDVVTCRTVRCGATLEPDEFVRWVEACTDRDEVGA